MDRPVRILFRADATADLGGGHVMRCLALAGALAARGAECAFACNRDAAAFAPALARSGWPVLEAAGPRDLPLPRDWTAADALVLDLYADDPALDDDLARLPFARLALEDRTGQARRADLILDIGGALDPAAQEGRVLQGPDYALLRPDFARLREASLARRAQGRLARVLIAMGLTDLAGISGRLAVAALTALPDAVIEVVLGPTASSRPELERLAAREPRLRLAIDVDDMAERMAASDLAIGAAGVSALERCALGLPSLVIVLAANQRRLAGKLQKMRVARLMMAEDRDLSPYFQPPPETLQAMSRAAAELCDGRGADRVAEALLDQVSARVSG
jgi:UDP-2,4-diacetamido-2,4,6-trideoxy-beta-L-altropyranose hydrolase